MDRKSIDSKWPNALRWLLVQNLHSFVPWHLMESPEEFQFAAKAFEREDINNRKVFVFASRQDNDDFAGLEIVDGEIQDNVIYFHPTFSSSGQNNSWNIVNEEFVDVFEFVSKQVVDDMKDWAISEDANDL
ncbi:hypothetical protein [Halopseudomonas sabulinigri]|uniref:Uncharacterized protein n=1 Tax=Halopseudomonas sabulinigri TaxID=472181 RepID=A0ABP9ZU09_9GAMM